jgi:hypothetical protein
LSKRYRKGRTISRTGRSVKLSNTGSYNFIIDFSDESFRYWHLAPSGHRYQSRNLLIFWDSVSEKVWTGEVRKKEEKGNSQCGGSGSGQILPDPGSRLGKL